MHFARAVEIGEGTMGPLEFSPTRARFLALVNTGAPSVRHVLQDLTNCIDPTDAEKALATGQA